jgi:predicted nucleic acid-binding protein
MGEPLILETSFLIDLEREHRGRPGRAIAFLEALDNARQIWERFLGPFYVLASNTDVCWEYGRVFRHLQRNGQLIGGNDLWIAATAIAYRMPLVTSNVEHFGRVPGLEVKGY